MFKLRKTVLKTTLLLLSLFLVSNTYAFPLGQIGSIIGGLKETKILGSSKNKDPLNDIYCSSFVNSYSVTNVLTNFLSGMNKEKFISLLKTTPIIPTSVEEKMGNSMIKNNPIILDRKKFARLYDYLDKESQKVLQWATKLAKSEGKSLPYKFKFYIYDSLDKNAMSLPGGIILVSKGIVLDAFKFRGDKQTFLEFTLAHEIAHNTNRHYTLLLQRKLTMAFNNIEDFKNFFSLIKSFSDLKSNKLKPTEKLNNFASFIAQGLEKIKEKDISKLNRYSNTEKEADACALKELQYGFSKLSNIPKIVINNLPKIESKSINHKTKVESNDLISKMINLGQNYKVITSFYFSSHLDLHPSTKERYDFLEQVISKLQKTE